MKLFRPLIAATAALAAFLAAASTPTRGDEKKAEGEDAPVAEVLAAAADLDLATKLIEYGRSRRQPDALITAALILNQVPSDEIGTKDSLYPAPAALLDEARKLRPEDKGLTAALERANEEIKSKERGSTLFVKTPSAKEKVHTFPIQYEFGKPASAHGFATAEFEVKKVKVEMKKDASGRLVPHPTLVTVTERLHVPVKVVVKGGNLSAKGISAEQTKEPSKGAIVNFPGPSRPLGTPLAVKGVVYQVTVTAETSGKNPHVTLITN